MLFVLFVEQLNNQYSKIKFSKTLSDMAKVGDGIASIDEYPDVLIKNCKIGNKRARGILLGNRLEKTNDYYIQDEIVEPFIVNHSANVKIEK